MTPNSHVLLLDRPSKRARPSSTRIYAPCKTSSASSVRRRQQHSAHAKLCGCRRASSRRQSIVLTRLYCSATSWNPLHQCPEALVYMTRRGHPARGSRRASFRGPPKRHATRRASHSQLKSDLSDATLGPRGSTPRGQGALVSLHIIIASEINVMTTLIPVWILGAPFAALLILAFGFKGPSTMRRDIPRPMSPSSPTSFIPK
jgi:hypothetical protein